MRNAGFLRVPGPQRGPPHKLPKSGISKGGSMIPGAAAGAPAIFQFSGGPRGLGLQGFKTGEKLGKMEGFRVSRR